MYKIKKTTKTIARYPCEGNKITGRYFNGILWCTNARIRLLRRTLEKIFFASLRTPEDSESINGITSSMMSIVSSHNSKITVQPCPCTVTLHSQWRCSAGSSRGCLEELRPRANEGHLHEARAGPWQSPLEQLEGVVVVEHLNGARECCKLLSAVFSFSSNNFSLFA